MLNKAILCLEIFFEYFYVSDRRKMSNISSNTYKNVKKLNDCEILKNTDTLMKPIS